MQLMCVNFYYIIGLAGNYPLVKFKSVMMIADRDGADSRPGSNPVVLFFRKWSQVKKYWPIPYIALTIHLFNFDHPATTVRFMFLS